MNEPIVCTRHLGKTLGRRVILSDISVDVSAGSVVGIIGKNGAGKTTLMDVLLGFSPATTGSSQLFGHDSFTLPAAEKGRIGFVPQQDELVNLMTGEQQIALTAALHGQWNHALVEHLQRSWDVPMDRGIRHLSPGERQKLSTLLALGHEPELLVLDEPVSALDPLARRQFLQELLELTAVRQRTVLFSTHLLSDLERIADQIWIVRNGRLAWQGALDALKESVVRLRIIARHDLPAFLPLHGLISQQVNGSRATAVVEDWSKAERARACEVLDAEIGVEELSLDDLFVEIHS